MIIYTWYVFATNMFGGNGWIGKHLCPRRIRKLSGMRNYMGGS